MSLGESRNDSHTESLDPAPPAILKVKKEKVRGYLPNLLIAQSSEEEISPKNQDSRVES
jgi:hypothetical protein